VRDFDEVFTLVFLKFCLSWYSWRAAWHIVETSGVACRQPAADPQGSHADSEL